MTEGHAPKPPAINNVLKIVLAGVLVINGLLLAPILPGQMAQIMFALVIGLVAMGLLLSGVRGFAQTEKDGSNKNTSEHGS
jgi:hypothetical protein